MKEGGFALYFGDEMRYGLMSNFRRSWSKVGVRAILPQKQAFENHYLFSAVSPITGESFHLMEIDAMDSDMEFAFLCALKAKYPDTHVVVVWDSAPCHRRKDLHSIPGLTVIALPPYSPELNPAERFFEEIRRDTCDTIFESLPKLEETIASSVNRWSDNIAGMKQLLGYEWIRKQWGEVS